MPMHIRGATAMAQHPKMPASGSDTATSTRLSDKDLQPQAELTPSVDTHPPQPPSSPPNISTDDLTNAFTTMSLPRQNFFFTTPIAACGSQGVPPLRTYTPSELTQQIETTTFTLDATSEIARIWLEWLKNLGDENAAWVRELEITVRGVEVRVGISSPLIRGQVSRVKVEVGGEVQRSERLYGDLMRWLNRAVEDVRERKWMLHGGGSFSRKELNKIGKVVFRLPAVCHELLARYERGEGLGNGGRAGREDESAIEDSDGEMDLGGLVVGGGEQKKSFERKRPKTRAQTKKEAFVDDELAFREHARSCDTCGCKWVEQLDGISEVYAHRVVKSSKSAHLVFAGCGMPIEMSIATKGRNPDATVPTTDRPQ